MLIAVTALAVVVGLLAFLVVGLLRSHAEILVRLDSDQPSPAGVGDPSRWRPPEERLTTELAPTDIGDAVRTLSVTDVRGEDLDLVPKHVVLSQERPTLIAFLSTGCLTCASFFDEFEARDIGRQPDPEFDLIVVPKSREEENLTRLRELAPDNVTVIMSSPLWAALQVPGSPYFALVDGETRQLIGAGSANGWSQVESLVRDSLGERGELNGRSTGAGGKTRRTREVEDLAAAGIGPGHPSLYAPVAEEPGS